MLYANFLNPRTPIVYVFYATMIIVIILGVLFFTLGDGAESTGDTLDPASMFAEVRSGNKNVFTYIRDNIGDIFNKAGPAGTINLIEEALSQGEITISECHTLLHLTGHESYFYYKGDFDAMALKDSLVCTQAYQHGVEAQIVLSSVNVKEDLYNFCTAIRRVTASGISCYHGAGHAVFQESLDMGYSLEVCDELSVFSGVGSPEGNLLDCYRGVFSEYANEALGMDGDTGLVIPGELRVELDLQRPFDLCLSLKDKQQISCVSQFTKVFFTQDMEESFPKCTQDGYEKWIQARCTKTLAGMYAEKILLKNESIKVPAMIFSWPWELRKSYILGSAEGFWAFKRSGIKKDWESFCGSFGAEKDRLFCFETFGN